MNIRTKEEDVKEQQQQDLKYQQATTNIRGEPIPLNLHGTRALKRYHHLILNIAQPTRQQTMATSYNPDKVPPPLSDSSSYQDWRKIVDLWGKFTTCAPNKQGMAVIFSLSSSDQKKVLSLPSDTICAEDGLQAVLKRLDELYLEDETLEMYSALEDFESYKRSSSLLINDFLIEFELKYDKIKTHGITYPEELLGFRLLKAANLSSSDEKLAKATSDLKYSTMKLQLKRLFSEKKGIKTSEEEINYQHEYPPSDIYYSQTPRPPYRGRFQSRGTPQNWRYPNASMSRTPNKPQQWRNPHPSPQSFRPQYVPAQSKPDMKKPPMNPVNNMGTISKCAICKSVMHWAAQCPHNNSTLLTGTEQQIVPQTPPYSFDPYVQPAEQDETSPVFELECDIILYQADYDSPTQISRLLAESFNCAVID